MGSVPVEIYLEVELSELRIFSQSVHNEGSLQIFFFKYTLDMLQILFFGSQALSCLFNTPEFLLQLLGLFQAVKCLQWIFSYWTV